MKSNDASIKIGAVVNPEPYGVGAKDTTSEWNRTLLEVAGKEIDFLSIHIYEPTIDGRTAAFYTNGTRVFPFKTFDTGEHKFILLAKGTSANSVYPILECRIDNNSVHKISVNNEKWSSYTFTEQISSGDHELYISYNNAASQPSEDRNLFLSKIEINSGYNTIPVHIYDESNFFKATMASSSHAEWQINEIKNIIKEIIPERTNDLRIAITEYNAIYGTDPNQLELISDFRSSLLVADLLHVFTKNQLWMANYWSLIGNGFFGCIRGLESLSTRPSFYVLKLLSAHQGRTLLDILSKSPTFSTDFFGEMQIFKAIPYLSVLATVDKINNNILLSVINKNEFDSINTNFSILNFQPYREASIKTLTAPTTSSTNEKANIIKLVESKINDISSTFNYTFPPRSLTIIEINSNNKQGISPPNDLKIIDY